MATASSTRTANGYCARVLAELALEILTDDAAPEHFDAASRLLSRASHEASEAQRLGRILRAENPQDDPPF